MKKLLTTIVAVLIWSISFGQGQEMLVSFNYNPATGYGDLNAFANGTSWKGWSIEGRKFLVDEVSFGAYLGYNGFFEERDRDLYDIDNTTINAKTWRYVYSLPILATAHYYVGEGVVRPYLGLGVGLYYLEQEIQFGILRISEDYWKFGLAPELGFFIPFGVGSNVGTLLNAKFHQVFYNEGNIGNLNYINYNIGIAIGY